MPQVGLKSQLLERLEDQDEVATWLFERFSEAQWPFKDAMEVRCMEVNLAAQRKAPGAAQELRRRLEDTV